MRLKIHMGFCKNPASSGDLLGLGLRFMDTGDSGILVVNWRRRTFVIFNGSPAWSVSPYSPVVELSDVQVSALASPSFQDT